MLHFIFLQARDKKMQIIISFHKTNESSKIQPQYIAWFKSLEANLNQIYHTLIALTGSKTWHTTEMVEIREKMLAKLMNFFFFEVQLPNNLG